MENSKYGTRIKHYNIVFCNSVRCVIHIYACSYMNCEEHFSDKHNHASNLMA